MPGPVPATGPVAGSPAPGPAIWYCGIPVFRSHSDCTPIALRSHFPIALSDRTLRSLRSADPPANPPSSSSEQFGTVRNSSEQFERVRNACAFPCRPASWCHLPLLAASCWPAIFYEFSFHVFLKHSQTHTKHIPKTSSKHSKTIPPKTFPK